MIRKAQKSDEQQILTMMEEFYSSPAVLHKVPQFYFQKTFQEICNGSPYCDLYLLETAAGVAGYALLAKTYSNEAGGLVVWIEEIYVREPFRGCGLGKEFFAVLERDYGGSVARFRLEVEEDNVEAILLYKRLGFEPLPYRQMIRELGELGNL